MFTRNTVFVIGAGASFELGLPVGEGLKKAISSLLNILFPDGWTQTTGDHQIKDILKAKAQADGKNDWNYLLAKCWLIRDALPGSLSIDNLLDAHRADSEIALIGKLAIAKAILTSERSSKLFVDPRTDRELNFTDLAGTWLISLFQLLSEGVSKEKASSIFDNVKFVVFNYDRCLEKFLPIALQIYYGLSPQEASDLAARAAIIHPYGRVGKPNSTDPFAGVPFGAERYDLPIIAEGIRTFSEGLHDPSYKDALSDAVINAEQVVFLGFAFHPLNMQLLKAPDKTLTRIDKVFGTTFGLSDAAVRTVEDLIHHSFNKMRGSKSGLGKAMSLKELNLDNKEASVFLQEHFRGLV